MSVVSTLVLRRVARRHPQPNRRACWSAAHVPDAQLPEFVAPSCENHAIRKHNNDVFIAHARQPHTKGSLLALFSQN
jgi:hypothetical protein